MVRAKLQSLLLVLVVTFCLGVFHVATGVFGIATVELGLLPRSTAHWPNIFSAPFVHGSTGHLAANTVGMLTFGSLVAVRSARLFVLGSIAIIALSGLLVWLFGRPAWHIGASGWVYGLWALTISIAWFDRKLGNVLLSTLVAVFYGGMSFGMLPMNPAISFEMHVAGVIAGVFCAYLYGSVKRNSSG